MFIYSENLEKILSEKQLNPYWFLLGDESISIELSLKKILLNCKKSEYIYQFFYPDENVDYQFLEEGGSSGLFNEKYIYIIRLSSLIFKKNQLHSISQFFKKNKNHRVIFIYDQFKAADKNKTLVKLFTISGVVVRHMKIKPQDFNLWVKKRLIESEIFLKENDYQIFCRYCFGNLYQVEQNIKKVKLLNREQAISLDIKEIMDENNACSIFDFIDSLYKRQPSTSLMFLYWLLKNGESLVKIIYLLDKEIRIMINQYHLIYHSKEAGLKQDFIFPSKQSIIRNYLNQKEFSFQQLISASISIGKIDRAIKGLNNISIKDELHNLIWKLTE